jgi:hypothetical protein
MIGMPTPYTCPSLSSDDTCTGVAGALGDSEDAAAPECVDWAVTVFVVPCDGADDPHAANAKAAAARIAATGHARNRDALERILLPRIRRTAVSRC